MKRILMTWVLFVAILAGFASSAAGQGTPPTQPPVKPDPARPTKPDPVRPPDATIGGRTAPAPGTPGAPASTVVSTAQPYDYTFPSGLGMLFFYVKTDKGPIFEDVVKRISEVLDKSQDTARRQQAAGWKIYKSLETPKDGLIYVFLFDPAIVGVDYDPVKLLSESLPADVQGLYDRLVDALIRVERMGLSKIR